MTIIGVEQIMSTVPGDGYGLTTNRIIVKNGNVVKYVELTDAGFRTIYELLDGGDGEEPGNFTSAEVEIVRQRENTARPVQGNKRKARPEREEIIKDF